MSKYPECEKIADARDKSQAIGEFLSWLGEEKEIELAEWHKPGTDNERLFPVNINKEELLAEFFGIDLVRAEEERRQMIKALNN